MGGLVNRLVKRPLDQCAAVCDAVVYAREHDGAAAIVLDHMRVPQRTRHVERGAHEIAEQTAQLILTARRGQRDPAHVLVQIEHRVGHPLRWAESRDLYAFSKPRMNQQTVIERREQLIAIDRRVEEREASNHHEVGRHLHVKPRRVDQGEPLGLEFLESWCRHDSSSLSNSSSLAGAGRRQAPRHRL